MLSLQVVALADKTQAAVVVQVDTEQLLLHLF
jgi:hypothetical protein